MEEGGHVQGGTGKTSYANNSFMQNVVLSMTRTVKEEAFKQMYKSTPPTEALRLADLGCACGPNTYTPVAQLIASVCKLSGELDRRLPEFHVYLNDLPGNDFNTVFRLQKSFWGILKEELGGETGDGGGPCCFFNGVPGSFYGRLFPPNSLHFVHSSYSLMWLSQVPRGLEGNKTSIFVNETSPPSVLKAYYEQFQRDFDTFLTCRSVEMVTGGFMVLTILGRKSNDLTNESCCYAWESFARVLRELVAEGLVEERKLHTFNIPRYHPTAAEIDYVVQKEGSFSIHQIDVSELNTWEYEIENKRDSLGRISSDGYDYVRSVWSVARPLLASHFGEGIMDKLFLRFEEIMRARLAKECMTLVNVTVSMMKKGASI